VLRVECAIEVERRAEQGEMRDGLWVVDVLVGREPSPPLSA
jgi:hypothetical protein